MTLDVYQPCPCGSGKKIKFCCSRDLLSELEQVLRAIEGEQRVAALELINKLLAQHGERAALLALKGDLLLELNQVEELEPTVTALLRVAPDNPTARAQAACVEVIKGNVPAAVENLQQCLSTGEGTVTASLYDGLSMVSQGLLYTGELLAARAHLMLQASLEPEEESPALQTLMQINTDPEVPLLWKQDFPLAGCPADAAWAGPFDAAMQLAHRGCWLAAVEKLEALAATVPEQPEVLRNLAVLRSYLGQREAARAGWRRYAELQALPLDERVEAEALAQTLDPQSQEAMVEQSKLSYTVQNPEQVMERLLSDRRAKQIEGDLRRLVNEGEVPPKGAFWLLDRQPPATGVDISRQDVPHVLGRMLLFGRQTDRPARLELVALRTDDFARKLQTMTDVLGEQAEQVEKEEQEEVVATVPATSLAMVWNWYLPADTPPAHRALLLSEQQGESMLQQWPAVPRAALDGKRPIDVAADPSYQIRLLASILVFELNSQSRRWEVDFNELRGKLGLPLREPIDPAQVDLRNLPLARLALVEAAKLSDDDLVLLFHRAVITTAVRAISRLGKELVARERLASKVNREDVFGLLARWTSNSQQALEYLRQAQAAARTRRRSPAKWLIAELPYLAERGDGQALERVLQEVQARHLQEPGIRELLLHTLQQMGLVGPEPAQPGQPPPPAAAPAAPQAPAEPGGLWTPGGQKEPSQQDQPKKSGLWIPGQD